MARKCKGCGALLSSHNPRLLCWPCQDKKKTQLQEQIGDTPHYTVDNLCFLLGLANPESVKRLGRKGTIPGRLPGIRQHLYLREEVDPWIHGAHQESPKAEVIMQKPYEETLHKQKMRKLAKALAEGIHLPSVWDKDLWRDLPVEFPPGKYQLPIGAVEICGDQIKVNYYDIGAGIAAPHLVKGIHSHLHTSGLSKFAELVGDKGKLEDWVSEVGQYSEALLRFLKFIVDEVKSCKVRVNFRDEAKAGLTKWFLLIVWSDVIQKASGYSWIDDSWYYVPEGIPNTNLWQLRCGAYGIGSARSKKTLKMYENWHKKLRGKYTEDPLAKGIGAKYQELSNTAEQIRQRLQEFSDIEHLPGHCELC